MSDVDALVEIYNEAIEDGVYTFDGFAVDESKFAPYFDGDIRRQLIVAEIDRSEIGQKDLGDVGVVGWASIDPVSDRYAYRFTSTTALYVRRSMRGRGVGACLKRALIDAAHCMGYHSMIGEILTTNADSVLRNIREGYHVVGEIRQAGFRDGRWIGLVIVQKMLEE